MPSVKDLFFAAAASVIVLGLGSYGAGAHERLPDLLILDHGEGMETKLEFTGQCGLAFPLISGNVVIRNSGKKRAKLLITSPLISAFDMNDPSFKDDDRKLNSLKPGETQSTLINIGIGKRKKGIVGWRKIRIMADPRDKIEESREINNTYDVWVKVDCS